MLLPVKAYVPVILSKTDDHDEWLDGHGVLVIYRGEPTHEELAAYSKEELSTLTYSDEGYRTGGYGKFGYRFYPIEEKGASYIEKKQAEFSWNTCFQINFKHEGCVDEFDLNWAVGIDFSCITAVLEPVTLGHGLDEVFLEVLKGLREELWTSPASDNTDMMFKELRDGVSHEYVRRLAATGAELDGFDKMQWQSYLENSWGSRFGLYAYGEEVCFKDVSKCYMNFDNGLKDSSVDGNNWFRRGTIRGCDQTDPRYVFGEIVDIYCAEMRMMFKEVPMDNIHGVFDRVDLPTYTDRQYEILERRWPPVQETICDSQKAVFSAYAGVAGDESWPDHKYHNGEVVLFREHARAPLQKGVITARFVSRGDTAPRGVYYRIECPERLTSISRMPESNIFRVLPDGFWKSNKRVSYLKKLACRPPMKWNHSYGSVFDFFPASEGKTANAWLNNADSIYSNKYDVCASIEEDDFCAAAAVFEEHFDPGNSANAARIEQVSYFDDEENGFGWNGENFYNLETMRAIISELLRRALTDEGDFYHRFARMLEAVVEKAEELNADPEMPDDFGVLVVGP